MGRTVYGPTPELRGAGGQNQGKTGQSITLRPLERRVGLPLSEWKLGPHGSCFLIYCLIKETKRKSILYHLNETI